MNNTIDLPKNPKDQNNQYFSDSQCYRSGSNEYQRNTVIHVSIHRIKGKYT